MAGRILIIDDEKLVLSTMERALKKVGYDIVAVGDEVGFKEAVGSGVFDLFIADLHMKGLSTEDLVAKVRKINPSIEVLIVSGSVAQAPDGHFLQKPFRIDELRRMVRELLDEPR